VKKIDASTTFPGDSLWTNSFVRHGDGRTSSILPTMHVDQK